MCKRRKQWDPGGKRYDVSTSQEMPVATGDGKRQGPDSPLELSEGRQPCQRLDYSLVVGTSDFRPPELGENTFLLLSVLPAG